MADEQEAKIIPPVEHTHRRSNNSCSYCITEIRITTVSDVRPGHQLSRPGRKCTASRWPTEPRPHCYRHHMIVKEIVEHVGQTIRVKVIHFDETHTVRETVEEFDLEKELYLIQYTNPPYTLDEVVENAVSELKVYNNENDVSFFQKYNVMTRNCEHFARYCSTGDLTCLQAHDIIQNLLELDIPGIMKVNRKVTVMINTSARKAFSFMKQKSATIRKVKRVCGPIIKLAIIFHGNVLLMLNAGLTMYAIAMTIIYKIQCCTRNMCNVCLDEYVNKLWSWNELDIIDTKNILYFAKKTAVTCLIITGIGAIHESIPVSVWTALPFRANPVRTLTEVELGDVVTVPYYRFEHAIIVTGVNRSAGQICGIHYGLPDELLFPFLDTRVVMESYFIRDLSKGKVKKYTFVGFRTYSPEETVARARQRIGEKKWWITSNRTDHLCRWAKLIDDDGDKVIHLKSELREGDVINSPKTGKGILIRFLDQHGTNKREFGIYLVNIVKGEINKGIYRFNLNTDDLRVINCDNPIYVNMEVRVDRAIKLRKKTQCSEMKLIKICIERDSNVCVDEIIPLPY